MLPQVWYWAPLLLPVSRSNLGLQSR